MFRNNAPLLVSVSSHCSEKRADARFSLPNGFEKKKRRGGVSGVIREERKKKRKRDVEVEVERGKEKNSRKKY